MTRSRLFSVKCRNNPTIRTANAMLFSAMELSFLVIMSSPPFYILHFTLYTRKTSVSRYGDTGWGGTSIVRANTAKGIITARKHAIRVLAAHRRIIRAGMAISIPLSPCNHFWVRRKSLILYQICVSPESGATNPSKPTPTTASRSGGSCNGSSAGGLRGHRR